MLTCFHMGFTDILKCSAVEGLINQHVCKVNVFYYPLGNESKIENLNSSNLNTMNKRNLQLKRKLRSLLTVLLLSAVGMTNTLAQPTGAINGLFSVREDIQIYFSQGNLQYQASTDTWRFAENQWDYVGTKNPSFGEAGGTVAGSDNTNISPTYDGWIDLFGWGTSGYNHGAVCYQPWSISTEDNDYYVYGGMYHLCDQTGQADWGYNAISNGGNAENNGWRTLTSEEWKYAPTITIVTSDHLCVSSIP